MSRRVYCSVLMLILVCVSINAEEKKRWFGGLLRNCSPNAPGESKDFVDILRNCMQRRALIAMDALLDDDVIPVVEGIDLIRFKKDYNDSTDLQQANKKEFVEESGKASGKSWGSVILSRLAKTFRTHVLKIDFDQLTGIAGTNSTQSGNDAVQGRRRRHRRRHHMMPMMMMGLLIMGSVLIPMGFQFLAVLGGKALILAKLALMLSSIQGLKKIATNGVNYGLYHSPETWHERSSHPDPPLGRFEIPYQIYPTHSHP